MDSKDLQRLSEDLQHLQIKLQVLRRRLNVLEVQIAIFGDARAPTHLLLERDEVKEEIARVEQKIQETQKLTESSPLPLSSVSRWNLPIGAQPDAEGTKFRVWANNAQRIEVVLFPDDGDSATIFNELDSEKGGYFSGHIKGVLPGQRYKYRLDGGDALPDPASRYQPDGVHGPSQIVDPTVFDWTDVDWRGIALEDLVIYEVHVGAATSEGTFDALIMRLGAIRDLGATAIELMPVADFPGERNWGYDGVCLFAPARAYGGPEALRRLVDAAHARGLAVILDAVFNHLGPDGNYLGLFSMAYFNAEFRTPWGPALNFSRRSSRPVRDFFVANACYWAHEYHIDGLRLDAIQAIRDDSEPHILAEIATRVRKSLPPNRSFLILAEDDNNDPRIALPYEEGGFGVDALWADDFHHQVRVALTGFQGGYYVDYDGTNRDIVETLEQGWFYTGQYSKWFKRPRGEPAKDLPSPQLIHCIENHDQVGNRPLGERLNHLVEPAAYRAVSALLLLSPYTPLLFMGQEWSASTPFLFFTDHHEELGHLVIEGRRKDLTEIFLNFPPDQMTNPQDRKTFLHSKLRWEERAQSSHRAILQLYHDLLELRRQRLALRTHARGMFMVAPLGENALALRRRGPVHEDAVLAIVNLRGKLKLDLRNDFATTSPPGYSWNLLLDTELDFVH